MSISVFQSAILPKINAYIDSTYGIEVATSIGEYRGEPSIQINVGTSVEHAAMLSEQLPKICEYATQTFGFFRWIAIMVTEGDRQCFYCHPWCTLIRDATMDVFSTRQTDGDLAKELLDSDFSGAIVTCDGNIVLMASPEIIRTANQRQDEIIGKSLDLLWANHTDTLATIHQELEQNLMLTNYQYDSGTLNADGEVVRRRFHAREIRLVRFMGRICRMTLGVEMLD